MIPQQGAVRIYQTVDDGEINVVDGSVEMDGGLESTVYLSILGGNEEDDGRPDNSLEWWGNEGEPPERQYRSETQYLLRSIPATSGNLKRIEDAVLRDTAGLISARIVSSVSVSASLVAVNRVAILIKVIADGEEREFEFIENWKADI